MAKGRHLGEFELLVMYALTHLGEVEAYGAAIRREIEGRTGREVSIGAVYSTLQRLERKGLIRSRVSEPQPVQGGRSRRCYALSRSGAAALEESTAMLARMMEGYA